MKTYKKLRYQFKRDIRRGSCYCILSGLPIYDPKQLSLEHAVPLSRGAYLETRQDYNIFPAYKIINNLKGNLLPCEWAAHRCDILQNALDRHKLTRDDKEIVEDALNYVKVYNFQPCSICFLYEKCKDSH